MDGVGTKTADGVPAALFWYARNKLLFDLNLENVSNVRLCKYEDLVFDPNPTLINVYKYLDIDYPSDNVTSMVHSNSLRRNTDVPISLEIDNLCGDLLHDLDKTYNRHWA